MRLLVVRHAIAQSRERFARGGEDDALRPLTRTGRRRMRRGARGLRALVPRLDVLAASPLVRARETAEILARVYGGPAPEEVEALRPDQPLDELLRWLRGRAGERAADGDDDDDVALTVAVVGHDPHLAALLTWLVTGRREAWLPLRKGGAALLRFRGAPDAGAGELRWLLAPRALRRLAE